MKYLDFSKQFKNFTVITYQDMRNAFNKVNHVQLIDWQKKGILIKLKRGIFALPEAEVDSLIVANELNYSYISLEYALSYYQIIPDITRVVTSVSKHRNEKISNDYGDFYYSKITGKLFTGFTLLKSAYNSKYYRMAKPEKALFDLVYLRDDLKEDKDFKSLRLNIDKTFKIVVLKEFVKLVESTKIKKRINSLIKFLENNKQ